MDIQITVALIGALAVIIAAVIGIWKKKEKSIKVVQNAIGKNNTQVGVQIGKKESD